MWAKRKALLTFFNVIGEENMSKVIIGYTSISTREQVEDFSLTHQEREIYIKVDIMRIKTNGVLSMKCNKH